MINLISAFKGFDFAKQSAKAIVCKLCPGIGLGLHLRGRVTSMVRLKAGNDIIWRNELHFNIFGWRFG